MKKKILKVKIEQYQYEFDEFDIKRALIEMVEIMGKPNQTVDFDSDIEDGKIKAWITITYKNETETVEEKEGVE